MENRKQRLILEQVSRSMAVFLPTGGVPVPSEGWIRTTRTALNMSLLQLARRMKKNSPNVQQFEKRESAGAITLQSLKEIAEAMDMKLVYAIIPKEGTLMEMVDRKAEEKAKEIIQRTNTTMALEDQEVIESRIVHSILEKKNELKNEMPKFLWD